MHARIDDTGRQATEHAHIVGPLAFDAAPLSLIFPG